MNRNVEGENFSAEMNTEVERFSRREPSISGTMFILYDNHSNLTLIVIKLFICLTYVNRGNQSSLHYSVCVCAVEFTPSFQPRYSKLVTVAF